MLHSVFALCIVTDFFLASHSYFSSFAFVKFSRCLILFAFVFDFDEQLLSGNHFKSTLKRRIVSKIVKYQTWNEARQKKYEKWKCETLIQHWLLCGLFYFAAVDFVWFSNIKWFWIDIDFGELFFSFCPFLFCHFILDT